jgi:acyl-CoA synthetase (AMP-forming)/AMP-acid ligase II
MTVVRGSPTPNSAPGLAQDELIAWCKERLSSFKCPKTVEFTGPLPRTTTGKVLKRELRSQLDGGY